MNVELFQMIAAMDFGALETQLALQCAPLLTGIKMSNLFIASKVNERELVDLFRQTSISTFFIYHSKCNNIFLLYKKEEVEAYLKCQNVKSTMELLGYHTYLLYDILNEVSIRYKGYMEDRKAFPHEIGLLLGYPIEDVLGFIENDGKNYIYTGYWKVYANLSNAIDRFDQYNQAKEKIVHLLSDGVSIMQILGHDY